MNRSEFGKIVKLARNCIDDIGAWGDGEIMLEKAVIPENAKSVNDTGKSLKELYEEICGCRKCPLGKTRLNFVFGTGNPSAKIMFVGEGPGYEEDHRAEPFVGKAGQLLTKIIESIGFKRESVYIANIVKCHPMIDPSNPEKKGNDMPPSYEEIQFCIPYLIRQIEIIKPQFVCALGSCSAKALLKSELGISKLRGRVYEIDGIKIIPTYHPAALLRNPALKKDVWEDMKMLKSLMK